MRKYLFFICLLFSKMVGAQNSNNLINQALDSLQQGRYTKTFELLKRGATINNLMAQFYTAQCYEYGIGVDKSEKDAFFMYRKAAERGLSQAMKELSRCYDEGIGIEVNKEKAAQLMSRYAAKGNNPDIVDIIALYNSSIQAQVNAKDCVENKRSEDKETAMIEGPQPKDISAKALTLTIAKPEESRTEILNWLSDVDKDIPKTSIINENTFALIIANENYQEVAAVSNALNDGTVFSKYCNQSLGIPNSNIHLIKDATLNNIKREINYMQQVAEAYKGEASFIIYYAGHGFPDEKTSSPYLLPVDGYTADLSTCYELRSLYGTLSAIPSKKVVLLIDACFSGTTRGDGMLAYTRGVAMKPKSVSVGGNMLVISSTQADETAYPYEEQRHGLFTYFLLKKLQESHGNTSLGELVEYITGNVKKKSLIVNGKLQTPNAIYSPNIADKWINWQLY